MTFIRNLLLCILTGCCWIASGANTVTLYLYNNTEGELIYPESPVVLNQACWLGNDTVGPDYNLWRRYAIIDPLSFANHAIPFSISSTSVLNHPSLEHCHYVASARPETYYADFTFYHTHGEYCVKNSATAKKLYAYLTSTGDLNTTGSYIIIITIPATPIRETCLPD